MSQFFVLVHSPLEEGFRLAGAQAMRVEPAQAAEHLRGWLAEGITGLVAIEAGLLDGIEGRLLRRVERSERLFYVELPTYATEDTAPLDLSELVEQAVGFSLSFGDSE